MVSRPASPFGASDLTTAPSWVVTAFAMSAAVWGEVLVTVMSMITVSAADDASTDGAS